VIVAVATWQLILHTVSMIRSHLLDPRDSQAFQSLFGMVLTLLIALEFKTLASRSSFTASGNVVSNPVRHPNCLARPSSENSLFWNLYQIEPSDRRSASAGGRNSLSVSCYWLVRSQEWSGRDGRRTVLPNTGRITSGCRLTGMIIGRSESCGSVTASRLGKQKSGTPSSNPRWESPWAFIDTYRDHGLRWRVRAVQSAPKPEKTILYCHERVGYCRKSRESSHESSNV